ncbi:MAG: MurR/RpiR family transcriptional regulator [Mycoplasmatales bacterium]
MFISLEKFQLLSNNEKHIANTIDQLEGNFLNMSIYDLASKTNCSIATISRFSKKIGYKNYKELKENFSEYFNTEVPDTSFMSHVNDVYKNNKDALNNNIIPLIKESNNVFVVSFGSSVGLGQELSTGLIDENKSVFFINESDFLLALKNTKFSKNDLIIYISYYGRNKEMQFISSVQKHKAKQILLTSSTNPKIGINCNYIINTNTETCGFKVSRVPLGIIVNMILNS